MNRTLFQFKIIPVFILFLLFSFCRFRTEPDKVWDLRGKIVDLTSSLIGVPYRYGGYDLDGFDCSGLIYYVYDCFGIKLPRTAKKQAKLKNKVKLKKARPGDILVFKVKRRWHTGIYLGNDSFIHAPTSRGNVRKESLNSYWKVRFKSAICLINE